MMQALYSIAVGQKEAMSMTTSHVEEAMKDVFGQCFREITASVMQTGFYRMVEENEYRRSKCCFLVPTQSVTYGRVLNTDNNIRAWIQHRYYQIRADKE